MITDEAALVVRLRAAGCVFAEDEARLLLDTADDDEQLAALVERRVAGEPLEHIVGWAEFDGLRVAVGPGVFVPRPRTEFLVDQVSAAIGAVKRPLVVDLCCGSGAVGAALRFRHATIELHAADVDERAVGYARRNLPSARVYAGDLYDPLPDELRGRVDVVVANAPYVPTDSVPLMPSEARDHEPPVALDGGTDGLDIVRRIFAGAPGWLRPSGKVFVETSWQQAPAALSAIDAAGLASAVVSSEELAATVVVGAMP